MISVSILVALFSTLAILTVAAQSDHTSMFEEARAHFVESNYAAAITVYDDILESEPRNPEALRLKGIAQLNAERNRDALISFYTVLQDNPDDALALAGAGVGFGNLGEYHESKAYLDRAQELDADNIAFTNYNERVERIITKYPYTPTEKPDVIETRERTVVPSWVKNIAHWWSTSRITSDEFVGAIEYLVAERAVMVPSSHGRSVGDLSETIPDESTVEQWATGDISTESIIRVIQDMILGRIIEAPAEDPAVKEKRDHNDLFLFKNYLGRIASNITSETRYIENSNPSDIVIKKFLRDYLKWNFDEEAQQAATHFPDPRIEVSGSVSTIHYNVFVNQQPSGLPLDHASTLGASLAFWEAQTLGYGDGDAKIKFNITNSRSDANVWVTWVVRDLGEGVLGHAHVGKGIVEVALGDYACDGRFQLYDVKTVATIMRHELGHTVGLGHSEDSTSIMFPTLTPSYAYCLL